MNHSMSCTVNPVRSLLSLLSSVLLFVLSLSLFSVNARIPGIILFIAALAFLFICLFYGCRITLNEDGIKKSLCGKTIAIMKWDQIREAGICATNVFKKNEKASGGLMYIYLSSTSMDDQSRFDMVLRWPPLNQTKMFFLYTHDRYKLLQQYYNGHIVLYNIGETRL